ncbi:MAG: efflux RND transporter periplasmic adaptor subunit [Dehalococcoidia bacterium]
MNKRKRLIRIVAVSLLCIGVALTVVFVDRAAPRDAPPETAIVSRADLMITAPVRGNLEIANKAYLSFGVTGTVKEVLVDRGDTVEKDQVLARLDAPSLEAGVEVAELQVEMARLQLRTAQEQYEKAIEGWEMPEGWESLEEPVEFLMGLLGPDESAAKASVDMARLNLKIAEQNLDVAKQNLNMTEIVAPFDGVIADVTIAEGQAMSAATMAAPAISLLGAGNIEMRGFIDELDIAMVELGQNVTITLDALPEKELQGKVAFISPMGTILFGVVSYETVIGIEGSQEGLRDGMSATADIIIERRHNVILIPDRAIRGTREAPLVHVYADGEVEERAVTVGLSDGINTEIPSGLEEGEQVVLPPRGTPSGGFFRR